MGFFDTPKALPGLTMNLEDWALFFWVLLPAFPPFALLTGNAMMGNFIFQM
jgi:hypothetical protein